ncbi:MAG: ATP-binding domain-containing protein, partial [Clostridiales bacterium]|nr:ATP-binding domain-containing protein [Clostridiales bacterium]
EEAFVRLGTPYRVYGGLKFYDRKEVKDLIAYMRVLANPDDDVSCRRVINEPRRSIGESTVDALAAYAAENGISLLAAAMAPEGAGLSSRARAAVSGFGELMLSLTEQLYESAPDRFLEEIIQQTGYVKALEEAKDDESLSRIENIQELQGAVAEFMRLNPEGTVQDFLENVALVTDIDGMDEARGAVTLMTLHSAKGLEFDCVFMAGMEDGIFPLSRAMDEPEQLEEERRLCYVGITRARKRLFLTCAAQRLLYNSRNSNPPSQFISEIPPRLIQGAVARGAEPMRIAPAQGQGVRTSWRGAPEAPARAYNPREARSYGRDEGPYNPRAARVTEDSRPWDAAPKKPDLSSIPGLRKGFGAPPDKEVSSVNLFRVGDRVSHRIFGEGTVIELSGEGAGQKVRVRFEGKGEKLFAANAAPLTRIK